MGDENDESLQQKEEMPLEKLKKNKSKINDESKNN